MKLQSIWLHCKQLDYLRRFDMKRQFLKIERLNVPNKSLGNWVSRLLWKTMEHFMLNEINKWQQNGITTELDNNTFAQPNNVRASFTFVINAEIEWAYTFPIFQCIITFFLWLITYESYYRISYLKMLEIVVSVGSRNFEFLSDCYFLSTKITN